MAGQSDVFVQFSNFRVGEFGTRDEGEAPDGSFTGLNVVVGIDGSIIPRCGLVDISPTGRSVGKIAAFGVLNPALADDFFYCQGTHVYSWAAGGAVTQYTGTFGGSPTHAIDLVEFRNGHLHYAIVPDHGVYEIDHDAKTVTLITATPNGRAIALYGVRLVASDNEPQDNRLYFSGTDDDPADVETWEALNFINVGVGVGIRGLYAMRDFLLIVKRDGELWRLSGVPGFNDSLRRISEDEGSRAAFQPGRGIVAIDNQFWTVGLFSTAPEVFTGGALKAIEWLGTENRSETDIPQGAWADDLSEGDTLPPQYGAADPSPSSLFFVGEDRGLLRRHGAWTRHSFGRTSVGHVAAFQHSAVILTNGGGDALVPSFWWWNTGDEKPPFRGGGIEDKDNLGDTDDSPPQCRFTTPEWSDKQFRRFMVRGVSVLFTEYDTGAVVADPPAATLTGVSTTVLTNLFTKNGHGLANGAGVILDNLVNTTGVTEGTIYYVVSSLANTFQLATAPGGTAIDLTGTADTNVSVAEATALMNHFDVSVKVTDRYAGDPEATSNIQSYHADPRDSDANGVRKQITYAFGDQGRGAGFQVNIDNLRGCKIHSIKAHLVISEGSLA